MTDQFNWDEHYKVGGKSAEPENYHSPKEWKHNILKKYYAPGVDSIIDVGCGDLQFWDNNPPEQYTGIDISQTVIDQHKKNHQGRIFYCSNSDSYLPIKADVVICFDMLYHILDDDAFLNTLKNLKQYSKKHILIYAFDRTPWGFGSAMIMAARHIINSGIPDFNPLVSDGKYQKYRNIPKHAVPLFTPEFELVEVMKDPEWVSYSSMYVFSRKEPE